MIVEIKSGSGTTDGDITVVSSTYTLGKGTVFKELLGGVEGSLRGDTLKVTSTYDDSISFDVVTEVDGVRCVDTFVHVRKVVRPFTTNINHVEATARVDVPVIDVVTPSLEEINLDVEALPRVGF